MGTDVRQRRTKGSGSRLADGRWRVRIAVDGVTRDFYGRSIKEARAKADAWAQSGRTTGPATPHGAAAAPDPSPTVVELTPRDPAMRTLRDWLAEWLAENRGRLKPGTWSRYERIARLQLVPLLGRLTLAEVSPSEIRGFHSALASTGLSGTSQRHAHVVLGTALQAAVDEKLIPANPARMLKAPRATVKEKVILSRAEAQRFLAESRTDRYHALWVLALTTGMRVGELLALRWRDVDLRACVLRVSGTVVWTLDRELVIQEPKTANARRQLQLSGVAVEALRAMGEGTGLVFPGRRGGLITPQNLLNRHFRPIVKRAGLPPELTQHDLRHTCATHLLEDGVPAHVVSRVLGHASVAITLSIYAHVTPRLLDAATAAMDARYPVVLVSPDLDDATDVSARTGPAPS